MREQTDAAGLIDRLMQAVQDQPADLVLFCMGFVLGQIVNRIDDVHGGRTGTKALMASIDAIKAGMEKDLAPADIERLH